jgi:hypothetical protein
LSYALNRQEVTNAEPAPHKKKNEGTSGDVYENTRHHDKMPVDSAGFDAPLMLMMQKNADFEGPLALICRPGTGFWRNFTRPRTLVCASAALPYVLMEGSR